MEIDEYRSVDGAQTQDVFRRAILEISVRDYSAEQIAAWVTRGNVAPEEWNQSRLSTRTFVVRDNGRVAGFSDLNAVGYINMLFVSPDYSNQGIAQRLLTHIWHVADSEHIRELTVHASHTARGFFERQGFTVVEPCYPVVNGVELTNFFMRCTPLTR